MQELALRVKIEQNLLESNKNHVEVSEAMRAVIKTPYLRHKYFKTREQRLQTLDIDIASPRIKF